MTVSVIIVTLNEAESIEAIVSDLDAQSIPASEILLVDGSSTDKTVALANKHRSVKTYITKRGVGAQRSFGGKKATSELLLFLDADVRVSPDFIASVLQQIIKRQLSAVCPIFVPTTNWWSVKLLFFLLNSMFYIGQKHFPAGAGPCIIVKRSVFNAVGGFRSDLITDDLEFVHTVGKKFPFGIIPIQVKVSDRRFKKYGFWPVFKQYCWISWLFVQRSLHRTNELEYPFGEYTNH